MIRYTCDNCGAKLLNPKEMANREDTCPRCQHVQLVPPPGSYAPAIITTCGAVGAFLIVLTAILVA